MRMSKRWVSARSFCDSNGSPSTPERKVLGIDCTHVKRSRRDRIIAVALAVPMDQNLIVDLLDDEGAVRLERRIRRLAQEMPLPAT